MFAIVSCNKNEVVNQPPIQKILSAEFVKTPYTYLQNKYIDATLAYELQKQGKTYRPERFSYEEKFKMINFLDSTRKDDTPDDAKFYQTLESQLTSEINSHPYVQQFVGRFAQKESYDENEMIINTGLGDTDDISKYQILYCYEIGFDVYGKFLQRESLTRGEEWDPYIPYPPNPNGTEIEEEEYDGTKPPIQKAVRYILYTRWGSKIEYMFISNDLDNSIKVGARTAMTTWEQAANNKIKFSEITKNITWNKFLWINGLKYFVRINEEKDPNAGGHSTVGNQPWAKVTLQKQSSSSVCLHELGHCLGLYHEQERPDRDNYITYYPDSVMDGYKNQFTKMTAGSYNYYGSTYDYNSIMHYYSWAFGKLIIDNPLKHKQNLLLGITNHYGLGCCHTAITMKKKDGTFINWNYVLSPTDISVIQQIYNY